MTRHLVTECALAPDWIRLKIEEKLGPDVMAVARTMCAQRGIAPEEWRTQPDIAQVFTTLAVQMFREEYQEAGMSRSAATREAAGLLDLDADTFESREKRFRRYADRHRKRGQIAPSLAEWREYLGAVRAGQFQQKERNER